MKNRYTVGVLLAAATPEEYSSSCLNDKIFISLEKRAVDQDLEFQSYFYTVLFPELKNKRKIVIVITYGNRFFHLAAQRIRPKFGKVTKEKVC